MEQIWTSVIGLISGTGYVPFNSNIQSNSAYGDAAIIVPITTALKNLRVNLQAAPGVGNSWTCTLYKNSVATALSVVVSDTNTTGSDVTNVVPCVAGDSVAIRWVRGGSATLTSTSFSIQGTNSGNNCWYGHNRDTTANNDTTGLFTSRRDWSADSTLIRNVIPIDGSITRFQVELTGSAPGSGNSKTFLIVKDGVDQDGSGGTPDTRVTIADAAMTGSADFTLSVVQGDLVHAKVTHSGAPASSEAFHGVVFESSSSTKFPIFGVNNGFDNNEFCQPFTAGVFEVVNSIESEHACPGPANDYTQKVGGLTVNLITAPGSGNSRTFSARIDSATPSNGPSVTLSESTTAGQDNTNTMLVSDTGMWNTIHTLVGSPAATDVQISYWGELISGGPILPFMTQIGMTR